MTSPLAQYQQAVSAMKQGQFQVATELLHQVVTASPQVAECHLTLGLAYEGLQQIDPALAAYGQALSLKPDLSEAYESYCRCLDLKPDAADGYSQMGIAFAESHRPLQAEKCFRRALEVNPSHAQAHNNLGLLLNSMGHWHEALDCFERAVALDHTYANAQWNLALSLLRLGNLQRGWQKFTWRRRAQLNAIRETQRSAGPGWNGTPFPDQTLLIRYEQGLGDSLQCLRYLPQVKALGGTVLVETPASLYPLLEHMPEIDLCVPATTEGHPTAYYDQFVYIMDLPRIFTSDLDSIPSHVPYLEAPSERYSGWRDTFDSQTFNVGIVWAGSPRHTNDTQRSCPLPHWQCLWDIPGVRWYSLQKGPAAGSLSPEHPIIDLSPRLNDFADTAAALMHLDLVISVDTAVLHLAGALNRPVWGLLAFLSDWRWLLDRSDSPWYPSLRLFRQNQPGHWTGVFEPVKTALLLQLQHHP